MQELLNNNSLILMEAAIVERLRRSADIKLHPTLVNAPLIYEKSGRAAMAGIYQQYIDVALAAGNPFLMCAPTWRANHERVKAAKIKFSINIDALRFLQELRDAQKTGRENIKIGGMIGCKNDCYKPEEGLSAKEAEQFHAWQAGQLKQGGADFIIAETLPYIEEAIGIARALESTGLPYFISFVISRDGRVLDGTDLDTAIKTIDAQTQRKPLGYMINCAYPSFLCAADQPEAVYDRLLGYLANASSLDHCDLDGADELKTESVTDWGDLMLDLNRTHGVKILGGCCGTGEEHLKYLVSTPD
jgi:S-methylmethionine-dependent homocysteine/selenocysteine methylase